MRKIALILLVTLFITACAYAESLPLSAETDMHAQYERYSSYRIDEATGEWSAHGLIAQQLLGVIGQGDANSYMNDGVCVLYPGVRGNRELSLMESMLYVCLFRQSPIKADALSITTGGVRYDFVGTAEETAIEGRWCERFALPLGKDALALLQRLASDGGEVRIYGNTRIYRTGIYESYSNDKQFIEAMSISAVREFLAMWWNSYALWDLNAAHWADNRPQMAAVALREDAYAKHLPALESSTQCLDTRNGAAVKAYQKLLKDKAFFTANAGADYGKTTIASTRQAQRYYGLLPTGMADRALIERLADVQPPEAEAKPVAPTERLTNEATQCKPGVAYIMYGELSIRLDRAWTADCLSPSRSSDVFGRIYPADSSNRLFIADGEIVNLSGRTISLPLLLRGYVRIGDVSYFCIIQCERDQGRRFGSSLLPMGGSRLVIACEIPYGIDLSTGALHITIQGAAQKTELRYGA